MNDRDSPVYEAVNKESRKNFFIGMHNEFVGTRAPRAAAFVCFKAAETGGEFLLADGRRIFEEMNPAVIDKVAKKGIRYSVMELPFFTFLDGLPEIIEKPVASFIQGAAEFAINAKVDFQVKLLWGQSDYDSTRILQARAPSQPGVIMHPETGEPHWFCNVHSHSSVLRKKREETYGKFYQFSVRTLLERLHNLRECSMFLFLYQQVPRGSRTVPLKSTNLICSSEMMPRSPRKNWTRWML